MKEKTGVWVMKENWHGILFLIPFGFLCLYADLEYNWAWAWLLLGAWAVLLGSCVKQSWVWIVGNAVSFGVSALCVQVFDLGQYDYYFKPLGAMGFAAAFYGVTVLLAWLIRKKEWLVLGLLLGGAGLLIGSMYWLLAGV